jgi:hypothetical protein
LHRQPHCLIVRRAPAEATRLDQKSDVLATGMP